MPISYLGYCCEWWQWADIQLSVPWNGSSRVLHPQTQIQYKHFALPRGPGEHTPLFSDSHGFFPKVSGFGRHLGMREELHEDLPHVLLSRISLKAKSITHCNWRDLQTQFCCCAAPFFSPRKPYCMRRSAKHNLKAVSTLSSFAADSIKTSSRPASLRRVVILSGWRT